MVTTDKPPKPPSNTLRYEAHPLAAVFTPKTVAVIGASEKPRTIGRSVLSNLIGTPFGGTHNEWKLRLNDTTAHATLINLK